MKKQLSFLKGSTFELSVGYVIERIAKEKNWKLIRDVTLPNTGTRNSKKDFAQIDIVLFTQDECFCIEVKNWDCTVYCRDGLLWRVKYDEFIDTLSPVQQNKYHISKLKQYVKSKPIRNIICFNDNAYLENRPDEVYHYSEFIEFLENLPECLDHHLYYDEYTKVSNASMMTSFKEMEKKYGDKLLMSEL